MTAVSHQAHRLLKNIISPTSQTSLTSGCRRQNSHTMSDVYSTSMATTAVKIKLLGLVDVTTESTLGRETHPGTNPSMLYDHGKLIIA